MPLSISSFTNREQQLAVIGLGYVGLPLALAFAKKLPVIAFDINESRVALMQQGIDPSNELGKEDFADCDIVFTSNIEALRKASCFIVAVPTPVDDNKLPDLTALLKASETVGKVIKRGDYVVFESTVYPGCTEEDCIPVIERASGLKMGIDFKAGYSPERINPGDKTHSLQNVVKVVAGCDEESLQVISELYALIVAAGLHKAPSIKVAEAAKIIENTQRDLNIALMNELSMMFQGMNINIYEVLAAAGTKWNFLPFTPGLVGGHCIGVDPYYLIHKAKLTGYTSQIIAAGRSINDSMGKYVADKVLEYLASHMPEAGKWKILVMGVTLKENVADIRNSKVIDVIRELQHNGVAVDLTDAYADTEELQREYGFALTGINGNDYDAVIVAVPHKAYHAFDDAWFASVTKPNALIADIKGMYKGGIVSRSYWSL